MILNGYSVRIEGGVEKAHGYVELRHGRTFALILGNRGSERANVTVNLDGKDVGTWRMERGATVRLERPANEEKLFTFYRADSEEGEGLGGDVPESAQGLLEVSFVPESAESAVSLQAVKPGAKSRPRGPGGQSASAPDIARRVTFSSTSPTVGAQSYSSTSANVAGVTGLSGTSHQKFTTASYMALDPARTQTVNLRLVCLDETMDPVPLRAVASQATPVPPPVKA